MTASTIIPIVFKQIFSTILLIEIMGLFVDSFHWYFSGLQTERPLIQLMEILWLTTSKIRSNYSKFQIYELNYSHLLITLLLGYLPKQCNTYIPTVCLYEGTIYWCWNIMIFIIKIIYYHLIKMLPQSYFTMLMIQWKYIQALLRAFDLYATCSYYFSKSQKSQLLPFQGILA